MTCPFGCDPAPCELCLRCEQELRPAPKDTAWIAASILGVIVGAILALVAFGVAW